MATGAGGGRERLAFIDALRGVAAIYVLLFHQIFVGGVGDAVPSWAGPELSNGGSGVTLFFLVSAFSLCFAHADGFSQPGSVVAFFVRRAARILPLFYVMLMVTLARNRWSHMWPHSGWQILRAVLLIFNVVPGDEDGIVPGAWSIGTEWLFYLLFPILFSGLTSATRLGVALCLAFIAAIIFHGLVDELPYSAAANSSFFSASLIRRLPVFLMGIGVWMIIDRHVSGKKRPRTLGAALILLSAAVYEAYIRGRLNILFPEAYYWEAVAYALLLVGLAILPWRLLVNRCTLFCGRISYSIYLLHAPVMGLLIPFYRRILHWPLDASLRFACCTTLTLACVLPVATASYSLIERPGMRLGIQALGRVRRDQFQGRHKEKRLGEMSHPPRPPVVHKAPTQ